MATSSSSRTERRRARRLVFVLTAALLSAPLAAAFAQSELPAPSRETTPGAQPRPTPPVSMPSTSTPPASTPGAQPERVPSMPSSSGAGQPSDRRPRTTPSDVLHDTERRGAPPVGGGGTLSAPDNVGGGDVSGQIRDLGKSVPAQNDNKASQKKAASEKKTVAKKDAKKQSASKRTAQRTWEGVPVDPHGNMILRDEQPGLKPPPPPAPPPGGTTTGTGTTEGTGTGTGGGTTTGKAGGTKAGEGGGGKPNATAYVDDCRDKLVPIPPPWGDPGWEKQKTLKPEELWILNGKDLSAEVWTYRPKKGEPGEGGLCVALPRYQNGTLIAMGIICQGKEGYACFWDVGAATVDKPGGDPGQKANPKGLKVDDLPNGGNLVENCTECHRGSNVFIGHAGIDTIGGESDKPYKPLSGGRKDQVWSNPKGSSKLAPKCQTCHLLPQLTRNYCAAVLKPALTNPSEEGKKTAMPPPDEDASEYKDDIEQLRKACKDLGVVF